jgi:hypothetical protein
MVLYDNIYVGSDESIASRRNFLDILSSLRDSRNAGEKFILLSSSSVFDLSLGNSYCESDYPNGPDKVMSFLAEAERRVLDYPEGYVFRVHGRMFEYDSTAVAMRDFEGVPCLRSESICPLSNEAYEFLVWHYSENAGSRKLIHLSSPSPVESFELWFLLRGLDEYRVDEGNPNVSFGNNPGTLFPSTLSKETFYKGFLIENMKCVRNSFKSIGGMSL